MDLIQMLTSQLNINDEQALGGTGILLNLVKEKLGSNDFSQIADAVPEIENFLDSAPDTGNSLGGMLGSAVSMFGGSSAETLGDLANLADSFSKLGLDSDMIQKFIPIITQYLQQQGGENLIELITKALKV